MAEAHCVFSPEILLHFNGEDKRDFFSSEECFSALIFVISLSGSSEVLLHYSHGDILRIIL